MKFVVRRLVVGVLALPLVAGAYVFGYIGLVAMGAEMGASIEEIWSNGFLVGIVSALAFGFATQIDNFVSKIVGDN